MQKIFSSQAWRAFRRHKRGRRALLLLSVLFAAALLAPVWSNDKPLWVKYSGRYYFPLANTYNETEFGGDFDTPADYSDPLVRRNITTGGNYAVYPPNPYDADTLNGADTQPDPARPSEHHWLGTDDRGRDVLARLVYGFRDSLLFALALTFITTVIGVAAGAVQGYFGGRVDLLMQRFLEIWGGLPELYLLIILSSFFNPGLLVLLVILSLFGWMGLSDYVRAEFLKNRQADYVAAAKSMGVSDGRIMWRHILPNSLTPVLAFLPFRISGAVLALTGLDFLGLGVPDSQASLGELLAQGKDNLDAWWIGLSAVGALTVMLLLLVMIGEGLRHAFDVRAES
ncbi:MULTISPECIES: ABC transporter permease [Neisseria]|uniref:Binding-protein-dependent transport system inner membrane component family protein n=1 Tax=Neisseria musculi TaxID=1815583 RepID=A0A7H1MC36_9NEIS|nr:MULTISPECIES: ABC transporter permease [Neisseria]MBF0804121.1 ABC transporter permease [Neisseria sp. 19428wB4_WF04]QNT59201.1 binding-protein-dependent transport system inner membrane component family protein [Neisseria musculi]TFU43138.1 ABC transporter permease [Neisseria sp. WF04]